MFKSDIIRTIAALACTAVFSATFILGAIAPADAGGYPAVTAVTRFIA